MSGQRGRSTTGTRIAVRIPPDLLANLDRRALDQGITRAEMLRTICNDALAGEACNL